MSSDTFNCFLISSLVIPDFNFCLTLWKVSLSSKYLDENVAFLYAELMDVTISPWLKLVPWQYLVHMYCSVVDLSMPYSHITHANLNTK